MNIYSNYWDKKLPDNLKKSTYAEWLDAFKNSIPAGKVLDLGCGNGEDTKWLIDNGYSVVSADFSRSAIDYVKTFNSNAMILDMSNSHHWQNFNDGEFSAVIANLSLHYFDNQTTIYIMKQIKRILNGCGVLIARVNTNLDTEFGAGDGIEIEPNFYKNPERGIDKRFFTEDSANQYFSIVGKPQITLKTITYIGKPKKCYEIVVKK